MTTEHIHTCSYSCDRPECIRQQRDDLAARLAQQFTAADMADQGAAQFRRGYEAAKAEQSSAAPWIDLEQFRSSVNLAREVMKIAGAKYALPELDRLLALIDASPKGATFHNDGNSEAQFIADEARLNCPSCGGSGHVEDSPKGGSEARDGERYRWLRERWGRISETYDADTPVMTEIGDDTEGWITDGDSLDRCIDAAMQASDAEVPNG
ncbi:hypothetical protein H7691_06500 [Stenotrophomonas sp. CW117]|uniref:hypothetical protein n=1 Tax=Stenotrophomonas TaxID=40323 RepID=UPI00177C61A9|nr:hypothetical protein [Stenotrophomonas sp. CW117]QOF99761.1 hypothetical protein H7691_06500 [Stenotrophomonas sp. CW117]